MISVYEYVHQIQKDLAQQNSNNSYSTTSDVKDFLKIDMPEVFGYSLLNKKNKLLKGVKLKK